MFRSCTLNGVPKLYVEWDCSPIRVTLTRILETGLNSMVGPAGIKLDSLVVQQALRRFSSMFRQSGFFSDRVLTEMTFFTTAVTTLDIEGIFEIKDLASCDFELLLMSSLLLYCKDCLSELIEGQFIRIKSPEGPRTEPSQM